jgi:hypothetical protein
VFDKDPCHKLAPVLESVVCKQVMDQSHIGAIQEFFDTVEENNPMLG